MTWPRRVTRARFAARLRAKPEYHILNASIHDDQNLSSVQAVEEIVEICESLKDDTSRLGNHLYDTACCILELAGRATPDRQGQLISVVHGLHHTTLRHSSTGESLKYDGDVVWREFPTFGYTFADELGAYS